MSKLWHRQHEHEFIYNLYRNIYYINMFVHISTIYVCTYFDSALFYNIHKKKIKENKAINVLWDRVDD